MKSLNFNKMDQLNIKPKRELDIMWKSIAHVVAYALFFTKLSFGAQLTIEFQNKNDLNERISGVLFYAKPIGAIPSLSKKTHEIHQTNKTFVPLLLPVEMGSSVLFLNDDSFSHSVYAFSASKNFELPLYKKTDPPPPAVVFDKPGKITLGCNIHDSMIGYIYVLETPYYALSSNSQASIALPPGKYVVNAWSPRFKEKDALVVSEMLEFSADAKLSLTLDLKPMEIKKSNPFDKSKSTYP